jgi:hypothetical protein
MTGYVEFSGFTYYPEGVPKHQLRGNAMSSYVQPTQKSVWFTAFLVACVLWGGSVAGLVLIGMSREESQMKEHALSQAKSVAAVKEEAVKAMSLSLMTIQELKNERDAGKQIIAIKESNLEQCKKLLESATSTIEKQNAVIKTEMAENEKYRKETAERVRRMMAEDTTPSVPVRGRSASNFGNAGQFFGGAREGSGPVVMTPRKSAHVAVGGGLIFSGLK